MELKKLDHVLDAVKPLRDEERREERGSQSYVVQRLRRMISLPTHRNISKDIKETRRAARSRRAYSAASRVRREIRSSAPRRSL